MDDLIDPEPNPVDVNTIWESVDPCAFLCYCVQVGWLSLDTELKRTLDAFGWLNEEGFPDYAKMTREFERLR